MMDIEKKKPTKEWYNYMIENCIIERQKYIDDVYPSTGDEIDIVNKTIENLKISLQNINN